MKTRILECKTDEYLFYMTYKYYNVMKSYFYHQNEKSKKKKA